MERGLTRLKGENYEGATNSLNRAIWDLEGIGNHGLRIEELCAAYQALGNAYQGLGKSDWAEEHWRLSRDLADHARADGGNAAPLTRAREAYSAARFREALGALRQALVDLEGVSDSPARLKQLEEARCYLAFAYFALDKEDRAREELHRLWVLDSSVSLCTREAPPVIRRLIGEVQKKREPR
ncbi:MAG TPA: hypothetical protein VGT40_02285 [Methylomirabilota bacterium]|nr:hypothetical protein [Methylomirabilota bacterium]